MKKLIYHKQRMSDLILRLVLVVALVSMAMMAQAQATVRTDLDDYPPGSTAIITGAGFQAGEEVELHVHHADGDPLGTDPQNHQPWSVTADAEGNFTTSWYVPSVEEGDALGATLLLEAHGNMGSVAEWTFTDGNLNSVSIGSQTGSPITYGTGGTATYTITVKVQGSGLGPKVNLTALSLPIGVTASFLPSQVDFSALSGNQTLTSTLTLTVLSTVKAASSPFSFTVKGTNNASASDFKQDVNGSLVVGKKALTVSSTADNKVYNGNTTAIVTLSDNRISGDVFAVSNTTATFANKNVGTGKTVTVSGINISGSDAGNYTFNTSATTTADITAKSLTVTAGATNKVYDGNATALVTLSDNRISGDALSFTSTASFADKNVGTGKTVNISSISISGGADAGNYSLSNTTATTTANITAKSLTVAATGVNKVYDATTAATVTLSDNRVSGDVFTTANAASFTTKTVGLGKVVSVTGISISGTDAGNYTANTTASANANITALPITGSITASNKIYDGSNSATIVRSLSGVLLTDVVTYTGGTATFSDKSVGTGKTVNATGLGLSGADAGNYTVNTTASTTADITARPLAITATAINKVYNGDANATVTLSDNRVSGDVFTRSFTSATFADANVGTSKTVTVNGITISGTDAGNYSANTSATTTANITAIALTGNFTASSKVYDRTTTATVLTRSLTGVISPDMVSLTGGTAAFSAADAATNKTVTLTGATLTGANAGNYSLSSVATSTADITPLPIVYSITANNKIYDATTTATIATRTLTGVLSGDNVNPTGGAAIFSDKNVANGKTVTATVLTLGGGDKNNYSFNATATALANITKASLTPAIVANDKVYDGTTTATLSSQTVSTILLTDVVNLIVGAANFDNANAGTGKTVTASSLSLGGVDGGNYQLSSSTATGLANISKASATLTWVPGTLSQIYDGSVKTVVATTTPSGLGVTYAFTGTPQNVGTYPVTATINDTNYQGSLSGTLEIISPATTTVVSSSLNPSVYGQSVIFTATITSLGGTPDNATVTFYAGAISLGTTTSSSGTASLATSSLTAGTHTITATYAGAGIFNPSTSASLNQVVNKAPSTTVVTINGGPFTYNGSAQTPATVSVTGAGGLSLTPAADYANNTNAGTATASYTYAGDANHTGSSDSKDFTIGKAATVTTVTISGAPFTYTGSAQTPASVTVTGANLSLTPAPDYAANINAGTANASYTYAESANHLGSSDSEDFTINQADATVTVSGSTTTYDAAAHGATGTVVGVAGDLAAAGSSLDLGLSFTNVPGGTAYWTFEGGTNYLDENGSVAIVINQADATVTVSGSTTTYDAASHGATGSAVGVAGDLSAAGSTLSLGSSFTNVPGGTAYWTFTGGTNYNDQSGDVAIVINKAEAVVTVAGYTGVYDAASHGATGSAVGVAGDLSAAGSSLSLGSSFTNVPGGTASWTFTGGTNYNDQSGDVAIVINKADAVVTVAGYTGVYDAASHGATGSAAGVAGDLSAAGSTLSLGSSFTNVPGGTAYWTFTGGTNYNDQSGDVAIVINKANAVVTVAGYTGVYDAASHGATGSASGVGGVDLSAGLDLGVSFTDVPGGTASWTFAGGTNYNDQSGTAAIVINKANAVVTVNGYTGTYDAAAHGATGSAVGVAGDPSAAGSTLSLGSSFTNVPGGTASWTFTGGTNYNDQSGTAAIVINKANAVVTVNGYTGTYDAAAHGATGSAVGVAGDLSAAGSTLSLGSSFTNVPGGTAYWTFTGGTNYNDQSGDVAIVINKANAVVTVAGYTGVYDAASHGATGSAVGVAGDLSAAGSTLSLGSSFTNVPGGTAYWTFTGGTNYNNQSGTAAIVINKANAVVTVNGYTGTYDAAAHGATGTVTGVTGDPTAAGSTLSLGSSFTNVPGGTASWTFTGGTNYNNQSGTAAIVINKANAVVTVNGYTGTYDAAAHGATGSVAGVAGDLSAAGSTLSLGSSFTNVPGGTASWTFTGGTNYNNQSGTAAIVINKANAGVTVNGYTGTYDAAAHGATGTVTGVTGDPTAAGSTLSLGSSFTNVPGGTANWTFTGGTNYNNQSGSVAINISKRAITITADAKFKCFGSPDPALTAQVTAGTIVSGDVATGSLVRAMGETGGTYLISKGSYTYGSNYAETYFGANLTINPSMAASTFTTNNNWLYFGYSGDQTAIIKASPVGGTAPYNVVITMNRPLKCNSVNDAGDEKWVVGSGGTSVNNTCPANPGLATLAPVSTAASVLAGGFLQVTVTLMQDAIFTATITDAKGCVYTTSYLTGGNANGRIDAEDVRCFAGNSGIAKVTLCHKTGSTKNPCVTICVDESAVDSHMAHGDFFGNCTTNCTAPVANARIASDMSDIKEDFTLETYPNPFKSSLSIQVSNPDSMEVNMHMLDLTGRNMNLKVPAPSQEGIYILETDHVQPGLYFMRVNIGKFTKTIKLLKE